MKRSKRYVASVAKIDKRKMYELEEAIKAIMSVGIVTPPTLPVSLPNASAGRGTDKTIDS